MTACCLCVLVALTLACAVNAASTSVTPIQKVLQMMEEMKSKGIQEKKAEEVRMSAFKEFCAGTSSKKASAIERSGRHIEKLEGEIAKATTEITALRSEVAELNEDLARWEKDKKAAGDVRALERTDYVATRGDYTESIAACEQAISVLRSLPGKVPHAASLLQLQQASDTLALHSAKVPASVSKALVALLSTRAPEGIEVENPKAYAYEGQSMGVEKMLSELRERFRGELTDLEKQELTAKQAYEQLAQRLTDQAELATQSSTQRSQLLAERLSDKAQADGQRKEAEAVKAQDESYLSDLKSLCEQKSVDFENRQQLRAEEISALGKAIEIISSDSIAVQHLPGSAAASAASAFAQLRQRSGGARPGEQQRAASLLHQRANALGSKTLALAALRADQDPFGKVKKMISDLIVKLLEEGNAEADHKAWCDTELATNEQTRAIKGSAVEGLTAEAEKLTAESARLAQEIADLTDEVAALDKSMANASAERQAEKEANLAAIADAKESSAAVAEALAVLRDFYARASEATSFAQQQQSPAEDAPLVFDSPYKGQQDESTGVIGMLEVIESDFTRLETETDAAEEAAVDQHRNFIFESNKDKATATAGIEHNTRRKEAAEQMLVTTKHSLESTQTELDAAMNYYEKLRPSCIDTGVTFEERVQRRNEELESLRDAYKILSGEDVPSLREMKAEQIVP